MTQLKRTMIHRLLSLAVFASLTAPVASQLQATVGPPVAPVGCPIQVSVANESSTSIDLEPRYYSVTDSAGQRVFPAISPIVAPYLIPLEPGQVWEGFWPQVDVDGQQVPPGTYDIHVFLPTPTGIATNTTTVEVRASADAAVAALGAPRIGTTRHYHLCSPNDGGEFYLMLGSTSNLAGIPTCAGTIPVDPSPFLVATASAPSLFVDWFGQLDASGESRAPAFALPNLPAVVGLDYVVAFVVLNTTAPGCFLRTISEPTPLTIQ